MKGWPAGASVMYTHPSMRISVLSAVVYQYNKRKDNDLKAVSEGLQGVIDKLLALM